MPDNPRAPPNAEENLASDPNSEVPDSNPTGIGNHEKKYNFQAEESVSFKVVNKIGQGGYGLVYAVEKNEGSDRKTIYAMKVRLYCTTVGPKMIWPFGVLCSK